MRKILVLINLIYFQYSTFASQKDYIQALSILDAHLTEHPDDALCKLQKLMIEFDQQLSWCLNPSQDQKDKLEEIKDDHHKGCIAAKGFLELIEGLPLPDYRILPRSERSMFNQEEEEKYSVENIVQIYPNPTTNWFTVNINTETKQNYYVTVFDLTGKSIISEMTNKNTFDFNLEKYSRGLYSIQIRIETEIIYVGKIVKE
jgi:hypothetical protein